MAVTSIGTNNPLTRKKWSDEMVAYTIGNLVFNRLGLMAAAEDPATPALKTDKFDPEMTGINRPIIVNRELTKESGDAITFELTKTLDGTGQGDDGDPEGNEEAIVQFDQKITLHERSHGVRSAGKMSQKRTPLKISIRGRNLLSTWLCEKLERDIIAAACGLYNESGIQTVAEAYPSTNRIWYGGQTTAGAVEPVAADANLDSNTDNLFGTAVISLIKRMAEMCTPPIRPLMIAGKPYYVMFVHPWQIKAMRSDAAWIAAVRYAEKRGPENPLFTGASGIHDGVVVISHNRLPVRTGIDGTAPAEGFLLNADRDATTDAVPNTYTAARAVLMGAQALLLGWGQLPGWYPKNFSYGRIPGIATDVIYSVAKARFNAWDEEAETSTAQEDLGLICCDTVVVPD